MIDWFEQLAVKALYLILGGYALWRWWEEN